MPETKSFTADDLLVGELRSLVKTVLSLGEMAWYERLLALNTVIGSLNAITNKLRDATPEQRLELVAGSMDAMIGKEPEAIIGSSEKALIKVNIGILGAEGLEMLTDLLIKLTANAVAKGMEKK